jgi:hypothetical protein
MLGEVTVAVQLVVDDEYEDGTMDDPKWRVDGEFEVFKQPSEWGRRRKRPDDIVYLGYVPRR